MIPETHCAAYMMLPCGGAIVTKNRIQFFSSYILAVDICVGMSLDALIFLSIDNNNFGDIDIVRLLKDAYIHTFDLTIRVITGYYTVDVDL